MLANTYLVSTLVLALFLCNFKSSESKKKKCCFSNFFLKRFLNFAIAVNIRNKKGLSFVFSWFCVFVQVQIESKDLTLTTINFVENHFIEIPKDDQKIFKGSLRQKYCFKVTMSKGEIFRRTLCLGDYSLCLKQLCLNTKG